LLADAPGLGKTAQAIGLLTELHTASPLPTTQSGRVLVLVPSAGLARQWEREFERFGPQLTTRVLLTEDMRRVANRQSPAWAGAAFAQVEIVPYSTMLANLGGFEAKRFGIVVLDEAAVLKGGKVIANAALSVSAQAERVLALSATYVENDLEETYWILKMLGIKGFPPVFAVWEKFIIWRDSYLTPAGEVIPRKAIGMVPETLPMLRSLIEPYLLSRSAEGVGLDLPPVTTTPVTVRLTAAQRYAYRKADSIRHPLYRFQARQRACAALDEGYGDSAKADWLVRWVIDNPGEQVIFRSEELALLTAAEQRLEAAGIPYRRIDGDTKVKEGERDRNMHEFKTDSDVRVLLGSGVITRGFNIQTCRTMITGTVSWNPAVEEQAIGRIRRIGSPFSSLGHLVLLSDTEFEAARWARVNEKAAQNAALTGREE
jgi:SNF2 family DNA or RNA helicase